MIRITRFVRADPALVIARFHADPARWLPRPITMHGAHEFHARVRRVPWTLLLTFTVGGVWEQDNAFTRHLQIAAPERQDIALFRSVTGELTALSDPRGVRLRYRASVERLDARVSVLLPAHLHARLVASRVMRLIAANLTAGPLETANPDAAGPDPS